MRKVFQKAGWVCGPQRLDPRGLQGGCWGEETPSCPWAPHVLWVLPALSDLSSWKAARDSNGIPLPPPLDDRLSLRGAPREPFCSPLLRLLTLSSPRIRTEQPPPWEGPVCSSLQQPTFQDGDVDLRCGDCLVHGGLGVTAAKAPGSRGLLVLPGAVLFMSLFSPRGTETPQ